MARGRGLLLAIGWALWVVLLGGSYALGRETEEQLLARIQSEQNPVKKAKEQIKLSRLQFEKVHNAYTQGHVDEGNKLLGVFVGTLKASWKLLQDSGRKASRQPEGFRELEIALREDVRSLQDLARTVNFFDRAPLSEAAVELEKMREEVLHEQFPGEPPRTHKGEPTPPAVASPGGPTSVR